jgi:hypothetical protein
LQSDGCEEVSAMSSSEIAKHLLDAVEWITIGCGGFVLEEAARRLTVATVHGTHFHDGCDHEGFEGGFARSGHAS